MTIKNIDRKTALGFFGIKGTPDDITSRLLEKYEKLLLEKICPRYIYKAFKTTELSEILIGQDIKEHIEGCDEAVLLAITAGLEADNFLRNVQVYDMAGAVAADALASTAAEQICDFAEAEIKKTYNKLMTTRYSPGYGDFPLSVQERFLAKLDAGRKIGVYASGDYLLVPSKSVTALIGLKQVEKE